MIILYNIYLLIPVFNIYIIRLIQKCWREHGIYNVQKLWKLTDNEETIRIPIKDVKHNLNKKYWSLLEGVPPNELKGKKEKFVSPIQILKNPKLSPYIIDKINNADTKYPILVFKDG